MAVYHLSTPLKEENMRKLNVGDIVYLSGNIFTARDMAHFRIRGLLAEGKPLPKDFNGSAVFHAGPVCLKNPRRLAGGTVFCGGQGAGVRQRVPSTGPSYPRLPQQRLMPPISRTLV